MPLITLMSDYGESDHYVSAVKAKILFGAPSANIIDITHQILPFNLPQAAYILKSVFRDFPAGTIHLAAVNNPAGPKDKFIAMLLEGHYFLGMDNGLFSLISEAKPELVVELPATEKAFIFPAKFVLAPAAAALHQGADLSVLGNELSGIRNMLNRQLRITRTQIIGHVIHIDHYGNLVTNIGKKEFEIVSKGRSFTISFSRESVDEISDSYYGRDNGDVLVLFNSNDQLEIAINQGKASELLGMYFDSPVMVNFHGE